MTIKLRLTAVNKAHPMGCYRKWEFVDKKANYVGGIVVFGHGKSARIATSDLSGFGAHKAEFRLIPRETLGWFISSRTYQIGVCNHFARLLVVADEAANARLIATAPELLSALKKILSDCNLLPTGHGGRMDSAILSARAIIKKIEVA